MEEDWAVGWAVGLEEAMVVGLEEAMVEVKEEAMVVATEVGLEEDY